MIYGLLVVWGWMTIYAVSSGGDTSIFEGGTIHSRQLIWMGISLVMGVSILSLDSRFIEASSFILYGAAIGILILTLFVGKEVNGAKSWIIIAGQRFQPSEFAKVATALALAKFMSRQRFSMSDMGSIIGALGIVMLPAIIVIFQNDTGSALVFGSMLIVFYREGLSPIVPIFLFIIVAVAIATLWLKSPLLVLAGVVAIAVVTFLIFYNRRYVGRILILHLLAVGFLGTVAFSVNFIVYSILQEHQQKRIEVLFDPMADPQGAGYNVIQSKIAIGSGGWAGKGYLDGNYTKYKFVPKQETDFIYCTIGEEFGWAGSSLLLVAFFMLLWRIQVMAEQAKTRYARIYGYSVLSIIFFHILVNVGMTIGMVPVIGIPLPFFSYGGSSLLAFTILIFLLINLHSYRSTILGSKS